MASAALAPPGALAAQIGRRSTAAAPAPARGAALRRPVAPRAVMESAPPPSSLPKGHMNSRWPTGVPPRMGEHLLPSGVRAPVSTSKTIGQGEPHQFQYPAAEAPWAVEVHPSAGAAAGALAAALAEASRAAVAAKGAFVVALAGGDLGPHLAGLAALPGVDWARWHVFWTDDRCAPAGGAAGAKAAGGAGTLSGYTVPVYDHLLSKVPIPKGQVHNVDGTAPAEAAAAAYSAALAGLPAAALPRGAGGVPAFDMVVLSLGPTGSVASLLPNAKALAAAGPGAYVPVGGARAAAVSLSLPAINAAARVCVVAVGAARAEAAQRALEVTSLPGAVPAQLVRPSPGSVRWILDAAAAADLVPAKWAEPKLWPRSNVPKPKAAGAPEEP